MGCSVSVSSSRSVVAFVLCRHQPFIFHATLLPLHTVVAHLPPLPAFFALVDTVLEVRRVGEWRAVERDMAEWAKEQGILRRTDHSCKRRFAHLEPEVYEQHKRVSCGNGKAPSRGP